MTALITGEESWLDTPAGRSWAALHRGAPEAYRWAPEEVRTDLEHAHRIISASGRVGPRSYGGSWFGNATGGASHRAPEWTWAEEVTTWPTRFLMRRNPLELDAIALHIRKASGERLTDSDRKAIATRTHRDRRHRGLVVIATGLMREKTRNTRPGEGVIDDASPVASESAPPPSPRSWHAPPSPLDACGMPDDEDAAAIVDAIVGDARGAHGDPAAIVSLLAREAAETWFSDHEAGTLRMTLTTKLAARLKAGALAALREGVPS